MLKFNCSISQLCRNVGVCLVIQQQKKSESLPEYQPMLKFKNLEIHLIHKRAVILLIKK